MAQTLNLRHWKPLKKHDRLKRFSCSSIYGSKPVVFGSFKIQPDYINARRIIRKPNLTPIALLDILQSIETKLNAE